VNRPERGHLREAGLERQTLSRLQEFRLEDTSEYTLGQALTAEQFEPGVYVDVTATSKGRGFQGGVKRHGFAGGPKTHGQSDRHRAPGSVGAGTTPGRVYKGTKMAGHMGAATTTALNLLVVANDPERQLLFVQGSVPGPNGGLVSIVVGRKPAIEGFAPAVLPAVTEVAPQIEDDEPDTDELETTEAAVEADGEAQPGEELGDQRDSDDVGEVSEAAAEADEEAPPVAEMEIDTDEPESTPDEDGAAGEEIEEATEEAAAGDDEPESTDRAQS
jgi:large subunit ribosomal protein L3